MIGYLQGKILKKEEDRILLLVNQVGYEVLVPAIVMENLAEKDGDDEVALYIYYHVTERQPKPTLIGFNLEEEKEFFQYFIGVEDIGPLKAVKALNIPVSDIARSIENKNVSELKRLKGIGNRTAEKIVASLHGKVEKFMAGPASQQTFQTVSTAFTNQVYDVLVDQLGHKPVEAKLFIAQAMERNSGISTPEELFDEIYKGEQS